MKKIFNEIDEKNIINLYVNDNIKRVEILVIDKRNNKLIKKEI